MAREIERKFLVKYVPGEPPIESRKVFQGYLRIGTDYEVRISNRFHLTVKKGDGLNREENIYDISPEVYEALIPLTVGKQVNKIRYWYKLDCGFTAELDEYLDKNEGVKTVEVEFNSEEEANSFIPPDWFGKEVTYKTEYKNSSLAEKSTFKVPEFYGCADSGYCFNCKIILADRTCFCWGSNCPKCGEKVHPRTVPDDLDGIIERYYTHGNPKVVKNRYENGKFKEVVD